MTDIAKCNAQPAGEHAPKCAERHRCWRYQLPAEKGRQRFAEPVIERGVCRSHYPLSMVPQRPELIYTAGGSD